MYPVSQEYKDKIQELDRIFELNIRIEHSTGTLILKDKDIVQGSFQYIEGSQPSDEFTIGGTVASHIEFGLVNKEKYEDVDFVGAKVYPTIRLLIEEGIDAHFLQPSQPSKMIGYEDKWEEVKLGELNIDIADRNRSTIEIKAIDNMIFLDKPYSLSKLSYPATLYQIYTNICNVADVGVGTLNFPNKDYVVDKKPVGDFTLRNILGFVAELAGSFAQFNRNGNLELKWYNESGVTITPKQRSFLKMGDFEVQLTGVGFESSEKDENDNVIFNLVGTDDYALDITGNELLGDNYEVVLSNILSNVENVKFTPYTANFQGDPALQAGDIITHIDIDGKIHKTIITNMSYKYRGTSQIDAKALPNIVRGFKSTDNRLVSIIKRVEEELGDQLSTLEEQQLQMTELIANTLGGYSTRTEDAFYIHDSPNLNQSTKIWKWGLGGFGYSEDGGLTYTTGITAEGSIVAELVSAGIVTADMIQAGILQSQNGKLSLNLNNAQFSFENGIVKFTPQGLKVSHVGSNQYSEIRNDGFVRKWQYGESAYLNDIWIQTYNYSGRPSHSRPSEEIVYLPSRFRNRENDIEIFLTISELDLIVGYISVHGGGTVSNITNEITTVLKWRKGNFNTNSPVVYVDSYFIQDYQFGNGNTDTDYGRLSFTIIVVGR